MHKQKQMATKKQCALLRRFGIDARNMTWGNAKKIVDWVASHGWRKPPIEILRDIEADVDDA